jgi:hypothetical protein
MDEGLVPYIKCGGDKDHTRPFVRLLDDDSLELYCLACPWTRKIGSREYEQYREILALHNLDWKDAE